MKLVKGIDETRGAADSSSHRALSRAEIGCRDRACAAAKADDGAAYQRDASYRNLPHAARLGGDDRSDSYQTLLRYSDPGEAFFDGQLVAIEEGSLTFRREVVWLDGRREKSTEVKQLRKPSPVEDMTAKAAPANAPAAEAPKPAAPEKQ